LKRYCIACAVELFSSPGVRLICVLSVLFNFDLRGFCRCCHRRGSVLLPQFGVFECHLFYISVYTRNKREVFASDCTRVKDHVSVKLLINVCDVVIRVFGGWYSILGIMACYGLHDLGLQP
jgi:hypothetical protein